MGGKAVSSQNYRNMKWKIISFAVTNIISWLFGIALNKWCRKKDKKHEQQLFYNSVRIPKSAFYLGMIFLTISLLFGSSVFWGETSKEKMDGLICFLVISPIWLTLLVMYHNIRFEYDAGGFSYRSFFGKQREYSYDAIKFIDRRPWGAYLEMKDGKKVKIAYEYIGSEEFIEKLFLRKSLNINS